MSFPKFEGVEQAREFTRIYLRRLAYTSALMKRTSLSLFDTDKMEELKGEQLEVLRCVVDGIMYDAREEYKKAALKVEEDDSDHSR